MVNLQESDRRSRLSFKVRNYEKPRKKRIIFSLALTRQAAGSIGRGSGKLSVEGVKGDRLYEIFNLRGGDPNFTLTVWATTDNSKVPIIYDKNYFDLTCRNR